MGLLGDILVGTLKIGGAIVCEVLGAAAKNAREADDYRRNSGNMSNADLYNAATNTRNSVGTRVGAAQALKDRQGR